MNEINKKGEGMNKKYLMGLLLFFTLPLSFAQVTEYQAICH